MTLQHFSITLHKLNMTTPDHFEFMASLGTISQFFDTPLQRVRVKGNSVSKHYRESFTIGVNGITCHTRDDNHLIECNGSLLETLPLDLQHSLILKLTEHNLYCSTIHLKVRDYHYTVNGYDVLSLAKAINAGKGSYRQLRNVRPFKTGKLLSNGLNIGNHTSPKYYCVYSARLVHNVDAIDWELRLTNGNSKESKDYAKQCCNKLVTSSISQLIQNTVLGSIEFILDNGKPLNFWRNINNLALLAS